jgi:hypothetical protein
MRNISVTPVWPVGGFYLAGLITYDDFINSVKRVALSLPSYGIISNYFNHKIFVSPPPHLDR